MDDRLPECFFHVNGCSSDATNDCGSIIACACTNLFLYVKFFDLAEWCDDCKDSRTAKSWLQYSG